MRKDLGKSYKFHFACVYDVLLQMWMGDKAGIIIVYYDLKFDQTCTVAP